MKIFAPFAGIVRFTVEPGQRVRTGDELAIIEAVKLETAVHAPGPGLVGALAVEDFGDCLGGDELLELLDATSTAPDPATKEA